MKPIVSIIGIFIATFCLYTPANSQATNFKSKISLSAPFFSRSPISIEADPVFKEVSKAYRLGDFAKSITETNRLKGQPGPVAEIAAYLLGDLYLKQVEEGEEEAIPQAMVSFQNAVLAYPKSEFFPFGQVRVGEIYLRQKLYYEALGSFERVVSRPVEDRFTLSARMGMARTYQSWGKWKEAQAAYNSIPPGLLLPEEQVTIALNTADILYQMGQFEEAYQHYKRAAFRYPDYRFKDPSAFFQFSESAYRARHFSEALNLFLSFYNIHPKDPFAPVALLRASKLLKMEAEDGEGPFLTFATPHFPSINDTLNRLASESKQAPSSESFHLRRILLSLETLQACPQNVLSNQKDTGHLSADSCRIPLSEEAFRPAPSNRDLHQGIRTHAIDLLSKPSPSITSQGVLLEAIYQLKQDHRIAEVIEIQSALLVNLPLSSPYRQEIQRSLHGTIVNQFGDLSDPLAVISLFHTYPTVFTKEMLSGPVGFVIAMSHVKTGLLAKAAELFPPIIKNFKHPLSNEARYQLGVVLLQLGEDEKAQQVLEQYQSRAPNRLEVSEYLGDLYFKQGEAKKAISAYQHGLYHHPNDPNRTRIYLKLSEVYRYLNDFDNEIAVYLKWIKQGPPDLPYMRLADTYFKAGRYKEAIRSYQSVINNAEEGVAGKEWAQLRLAMSYELMGEKGKGKQLFHDIAQKAKDPLIKQMAEEKVSAS